MRPTRDNLQAICPCPSPLFCSFEPLAPDLTCFKYRANVAGSRFGIVCIAEQVPPQGSHEVPCHLSLFRKHFDADGEYHRDASLVPRLRVWPTWDMIAGRAEPLPRLSGGRLSISRPPQFSARYAPRAMLVIRDTGHGGRCLRCNPALGCLTLCLSRVLYR